MSLMVGADLFKSMYRTGCITILSSCRNVVCTVDSNYVNGRDYVNGNGFAFIRTCARCCSLLTRWLDTSLLT